MSTDRSNSAATVADHLARARDHYQRGLESHVMAAEEIDAALSINPDLSYHEIGEAMGVVHTTVMRLYDWWKSGADRTDPPFGGEDARSARLARAGRQVIRERPELIRTELLKDPKSARQMIRDLQKGLQAMKPKRSPALVPDPKAKSVLRPLDRIEMGKHLLIVGDSTNPHIKWKVLEYLGWLRDKKLSEHPSRVEVEMPVVVVTDPPYGQNEEGVPGDDNAYWKDVYDLFKPRGGFSFCAYRPPIFRVAEQGIIDAKGTPIHYLAYRTKGALGQGPEGRLLSELQSIIYWERNGEDPWIRGREAIKSVLESKEEESREDLKEARKIHATPKPVDVMEKLIERVTEEGDLVLDPFTGSGSTLIACDRTKRRCIAIELKPILAEGAIQRWQKATDGKAIVYRYPVDDSEEHWQRMPLEEADKNSPFPIKPFSFIAFDDLLATGERT